MKTETLGLLFGTLGIIAIIILGLNHETQERRTEYELYEYVSKPLKAAVMENGQNNETDEIDQQSFTYAFIESSTDHEYTINLDINIPVQHDCSGCLTTDNRNMIYVSSDVGIIDIRDFIYKMILVNGKKHIPSRTISWKVGEYTWQLPASRKYVQISSKYEIYNFEL